MFHNLFCENNTFRKNVATNLFDYRLVFIFLISNFATCIDLTRLNDRRPVFNAKRYLACSGVFFLSAKTR